MIKAKLKFNKNKSRLSKWKKQKRVWCSQKFNDNVNWYQQNEWCYVRWMNEILN